jgi:hypothetical protein
VDNIQPIQGDAGRFLRDCQLHLEQWDFVFHDAAHGDAVLPEYLDGCRDCRQARYPRLGPTERRQPRGCAFAVLDMVRDVGHAGAGNVRRPWLTLC